jgi:hypothetical protein
MTQDRLWTDLGTAGANLGKPAGSRGRHLGMPLGIRGPRPPTDGLTWDICVHPLWTQVRHARSHMLDA